MSSPQSSSGNLPEPPMASSGGIDDDIICVPTFLQFCKAAFYSGFLFVNLGI